MIHKTDNGQYVISSKRYGYLPGVYDTEKTATYAFRFNIKILNDLQNSKNLLFPDPEDADKRVITYKDLKNIKENKT